MQVTCGVKVEVLDRVLASMSSSIATKEIKVGLGIHLSCIQCIDPLV